MRPRPNDLLGGHGDSSQDLLIEFDRSALSEALDEVVDSTGAPLDLESAFNTLTCLFESLVNSRLSGRHSKEMNAALTDHLPDIAWGAEFVRRLGDCLAPCRGEFITRPEPQVAPPVA